MPLAVASCLTIAKMNASANIHELFQVAPHINSNFRCYCKLSNASLSCICLYFATFLFIFYSFSPHPHLEDLLLGSTSYYIPLFSHVIFRRYLISSFFLLLRPILFPCFASLSHFVLPLQSSYAVLVSMLEPPSAFQYSINL